MSLVSVAASSNSPSVTIRSAPAEYGGYNQARHPNTDETQPQHPHHYLTGGNNAVLKGRVMREHEAAWGAVWSRNS